MASEGDPAAADDNDSGQRRPIGPHRSYGIVSEDSRAQLRAEDRQVEKGRDYVVLPNWKKNKS